MALEQAEFTSAPIVRAEYGSANTSSSPYSSWSRDWSDMGVLEKVFDILSRGEYASANVVRGLLEGDTNIMGNAWDGLSGKQRGDFIDVLRANDMPWAPVLGTVLNIGLDPFTYLGGPVNWFNKARKSSTAVAKLGGSVDDVVKQIDTVVKKNSVVDTLGKAFVPGWKVPKKVVQVANEAKYGMQDEVSNAVKDVQKILGNITPKQNKLMVDWRLSGNMPKGADEVKQLSKAMDWWEEATQKALDFRLITPNAVKKHSENGLSDYLPNVLHGFFDSWMPGRKILTKTSMPNFAKGKTTVFNIHDWQYLSNSFEKLSKLDDLDEIRRTATNLFLDESRVVGKGKEVTKIFDNSTVKHIGDLIKTADGNVAKVKNDLHALAVNYAPLDEMDKLMGVYKSNLAQARWQDNVLNYVLQDAPETNTWKTALKSSDFVSDPGKKVVIRKNEVARVLDGLGKGEGSRTSQALRQVARKKQGKFFDLQDIDADLAREILDDKTLVNQISISHLDNEVFDYLTTAEKNFSGRDPASNAILKWFDKLQGMWKRSATIYRLPFHMRNAVSNEVMMVQAGMNPVDLVKYGKKAMQIQKGGETAITIGKVTRSADAWGRLLGQKGIRGWGWMKSLTPEDLYSESYLTMMGKANNTKKSIKDILTMPAKKMQQLGTAIEDNARISATLWGTERSLKTTASFDDAFSEGVRIAQKHLFQYDQVTEFEQSAAKRAIPFYTWMRKSIPNQIDNLLRRPKNTKFAVQAYQGLRQTNPMTQGEQSRLPDYMKENMYFKAPDWLKKVAGSKKDVYVSVGLPWQDLASIAKPVETLLSSLTPALLVINMGLNVNDFPHPGTPIEKFKGDMVPAPWPVTLLPEVTWGLMGVETITHKKTGKRVLGMPAKAAQALYDLVPPVRELNKMFKTTADVEDSDVPWAWLKYATGINFTPQDRGEQLYYQKIKRNKKLSDIARRMNLLGRPLTKDELAEYFKN